MAKPPPSPRRQRLDLVTVGALAGAHGVRGDVKVKSFTEDPSALFGYGPLLSAAGQPILVAKQVRPAKDHFIVSPERPVTREAWEAMKGTTLHVPRSVLPALEAGEIYIDDLIGLKAVSSDGQGLGTVKAVQNFGAGDLLEIVPTVGGKSVLIPFTEADVPLVDSATATVQVSSWELWTADDPGADENE
ncbi:MAG: ribosome maturation factor RimM [Pseudomonadota bacterium]